MLLRRSFAKMAITTVGIFTAICLNVATPVNAQDTADDAAPPAQASHAYLPLTVNMTSPRSDRGECDGLDGCVTLTHAGEYTFADQDATLDQAEAVEFTCPATNPYVWDWGYVAGNGLSLWLDRTTMPPADGRGELARFHIMRTVAPGPARSLATQGRIESGSRLP